MKCDICKKMFEYSEDVIHHWTLKINGELKPHTHVCIECEEKLCLEIKSIKI